MTPYAGCRSMSSAQQTNHELSSPPKYAFRRLPSDLGAWICLDVYGHLIRADSQSFADIHGYSTWHYCLLCIIEGFAEGTAAITKVFSGTISDYFGKRKILAVFGYSLSAMTKLVFPLATTIGWVFGARFVDRIGKGIRGAPRDALVADIAPLELRGAAYGLRQSLDSIGAFIGPVIAVLFMIWFANDIRAVLWVAVVPALIAVFLLISAAARTRVRGP